MDEKEKQKILSLYLLEDGTIKTIPSKDKRKRIILQEVVQRFEKQRSYRETEVNDILQSIYADFSYLRRLLIDYQLLERTRDGQWDWVKDTQPLERSEGVC